LIRPVVLGLILSFFVCQQGFARPTAAGTDALLELCEIVLGSPSGAADPETLLKIYTQLILGPGSGIVSQQDFAEMQSSGDPFSLSSLPGSLHTAFQGALRRFQKICEPQEGEHNGGVRQLLLKRAQELRTKEASSRRIQNRVQRRTRTPGRLVHFTREGIEAYRLSPIGDRILLFPTDPMDQPSLVDAQTGKEVRSFTESPLFGAGEGPSAKSEFSPDGRLLVVPELGGTLGIYDAHRGSLIDRITFPGAYEIQQALFSPDSSLLALGESTQTQVHIFNLKSKTWSGPHRPLRGKWDPTLLRYHDDVGTGRIEPLRFSPDGIRLLTRENGDSLGVRYLGDLKTKFIPHPVPVEGHIKPVTFMGESDLVKLPGLVDYATLGRFDWTIDELTFPAGSLWPLFPSFHYLAHEGAWPLIIYNRQLDTLGPVAFQNGVATLGPLVATADRRDTLSLGRIPGTRLFYRAFEHGEIAIHDIDTFKEVGRLSLHSTWLKQVQLSQVGSTLVIHTKRGTFTSYDFPAVAGL
jgi:hypothetical protein